VIPGHELALLRRANQHVAGQGDVLGDLQARAVALLHQLRLDIERRNTGPSQCTRTFFSLICAYLAVVVRGGQGKSLVHPVYVEASVSLWQPLCPDVLCANSEYCMHGYTCRTRLVLARGGG